MGCDGLSRKDFLIHSLLRSPQDLSRPSQGGRIPGSRAAALVGVHRVETVGLFASFWSQKEGPIGCLPPAKKPPSSQNPKQKIRQ